MIKISKYETMNIKKNKKLERFQKKNCSDAKISKPGEKN